MMNAMDDADAIWPDLTYSAWRETLATLHLWTQIVGKIRLTLTPWLNHGWHSPLYVTARGLGTSPIPIGRDFRDRVRFCRPSARRPNQPRRTNDPVRSGRSRSPISIARRSISSTAWALRSRSRRRRTKFRTRSAFQRTGSTPLMTRPPPIASGARSCRRIASSSSSARGFLGKASPVHFFWGSFDLAVTRFSGRMAPLHPGGVPGLPDAVAREAYSHEVSSAGFWPGNEAFPRAAFYSYAYPEPAGFRDRAVAPGATFDATLGEFILPYDTVAASAGAGRLAARLPVDDLRGRSRDRRLGPRRFGMPARRSGTGPPNPRAPGNSLRIWRHAAVRVKQTRGRFGAESGRSLDRRPSLVSSYAGG